VSRLLLLGTLRLDGHGLLRTRNSIELLLLLPLRGRQGWRLCGRMEQDIPAVYDQEHANNSDSGFHNHLLSPSCSWAMHTVLRGIILFAVGRSGLFYGNDPGHASF
jgi:hypothetical protein